MIYFCGIIDIILKCIWRGKGSRKVKTILKKNNKVRRISLPDFKTYYITTVIEATCYWQREIHIYQ